MFYSFYCNNIYCIILKKTNLGIYYVYSLAVYRLMTNCIFRRRYKYFEILMYFYIHCDPQNILASRTISVFHSLHIVDFVNALYTAWLYMLIVYSFKKGVQYEPI